MEGDAGVTGEWRAVGGWLFLSKTMIVMWLKKFKLYVKDFIVYNEK